MTDRESVQAINSEKKLRESLGLYEEQYDPSGDFSIFIPQASKCLDKKGNMSQIETFSYHGSDDTIMKGKPSSTGT